MANPVTPYGFESMNTNLHALWAVNSDETSTIASRIPADGWVPAINEWVDRCKADSGIWTRGWRREIQLKQDAQIVRSTLIAALDEAGAIASPAGSTED